MAFSILRVLIPVSSCHRIRLWSTSNSKYDFGGGANGFTEPMPSSQSARLGFGGWCCGRSRLVAEDSTPGACSSELTNALAPFGSGDSLWPGLSGPVNRGIVNLGASLDGYL